jgi:hypothetical protein
MCNTLGDSAYGVPGSIAFGLLAPDVDRQAALRAWPRFSVGSVVYLACVPLGQLSPIAVVVVCGALAIYYVFERLPDIRRQPAAS